MNIRSASLLVAASLATSLAAPLVSMPASAQTPAARPGITQPTSNEVDAAMAQMLQSMQNAQSDVLKMVKELVAKQQGALSTCQTKVDAQGLSTQAAIKAGITTKQLSPLELHAYQVSHTALVKKFSGDAKTPVTPATCETFLAGLKAEHDKIINLSRPMALGECIARLEPVLKDMQQTMATARARGMITPVEEITYRKDEEARRRDWEAKSKGGVTVNECRDHLNGIEAQKLAVDKMAAGR